MNSFTSSPERSFFRIVDLVNPCVIYSTNARHITPDLEVNSLSIFEYLPL